MRTGTLAIKERIMMRQRPSKLKDLDRFNLSKKRPGKAWRNSFKLKGSEPKIIEKPFTYDFDSIEASLRLNGKGHCISQQIDEKY